MLIGELSTKTGLTRDAIRFYERNGLLTSIRKEKQTNNYKEYPEEVLTKINAIKSLKQFGFTIHDIKDMLEAWETGSFDCAEEKPKVLKRIALIEEQINKLMEMKSKLVRSIQHCPDECEIVNVLK
jgi:DNA-binding transcriptional MerR regulator